MGVRKKNRAEALKEDVKTLYIRKAEQLPYLST